MKTTSYVHPVDVANFDTDPRRSVPPSTSHSIDSDELLHETRRLLGDLAALSDGEFTAFAAAFRGHLATVTTLKAADRKVIQGTLGHLRHLARKGGLG